MEVEQVRHVSTDYGRYILHLCEQLMTALHY